MITREILWNVQPFLVQLLYGLCALAGIWIAAVFYRRSRLWNQARPDGPARPGGVARLIEYLLTHRVIARDRYAGIMHLLIFWGFVIELIATTLVAIQHHLHVVFLTGGTYLVFSLVSDLGGLALGAGLAMALWRRRRNSPHVRLQKNPAITALLWLLFAITVSGFFLEAARIATTFPSFERWSVVAYALAKGMAFFGMNAETAVSAHRLFWIGHAAIAVVFFVIIPLSLMKHVALGAYTVMRPRGKAGRFSGEVVTELPMGAHSFRRLDLVQADACLTCGRCSEVCPAQAAGKPLSPRGIVLGLRHHLDTPGSSLFDHIKDSALWSCTTCHACDAACPVSINIVDKIALLRQGRVQEGLIGEGAADALESTAQKYNPFLKPNSARMDWANGLKVPVAKEEEPIELLYWVGCAGAFDPAGKEVTRAMVAILNHLEISYKVLGCGERCTGDPARRLGEEGLWQELATSNQQTFEKHAVKTILTSCPHCFNSIKNEYPTVGPTPDVMHHSQWLQARLAEGALQIKRREGEKITFHDPCYLARANDEIVAPRAILDSLTTAKPQEMEASGKQGFCCGGGGGQMWLDVRGTERVESIRAGHVEKTGATTVATGCPFCKVMLEAGRTSLPEGQGKWQVRDLSELVAESLSGAPPV